MLAFSPIYAEAPLRRALDKLPTTSLPYRAGDPYSIAFASVPDKINGSYGKVYADLQCSIYDDGIDDYAPIALIKYAVPDTDYYLVDVKYGLIDNVTSVLYLTDNSGEVLDHLEVYIVCNARIMDYTIDADGNVTVCRIIPDTQKDSEFTQFTGERRDVTYSVSGGKFVKTRTVEYEKAVYTWEQLGGDYYYCVWNGTEKVKSTSDTPSGGWTKEEDFQILKLKIRRIDKVPVLR